MRSEPRSQIPSISGIAPKDTTYTYEIVSAAEGGYVARCKEIAVEATGATTEAAVDELRDAIALKLKDVEAVVPPPLSPITFRLVEDESRPSLDAGGPGDPGLPRGRTH